MKIPETPGIPAIDLKIPKEIRSVLQPMKEILSVFTDPKNPVARMNTLVKAGIVDANGNVMTSQIGPIPTPTGLTAGGALANIILSWDPIADERIAHTEIWRAQTNSFALAQKIGTAPGVVYVDNVGATATRYYWIRFVTTGNLSGPFNAQIGVEGKTGNDPALLLELLTGQIKETQLFSTLSGRINLVDADALVTGSVNARIKTETDARTTAITSEATTRQNADTAEATKRETLSSALIGANEPGTLALGTITSGMLFDERQARSTADSSEVSARQALSTKVTGVADPSAVTLDTLSAGLLYDERIARSTADSSEVTARQSLSAKLTGANDPASLTLDTIASGLIYDEKTARVTRDNAIASDVSTLTTTVNGNTATLQTHATSINGLEAQYTVKTDVNGHVAGYGLATTTVNATPTSAFGVRADQFFVAPATDFTQETAPSATAVGQIWYKSSTKETFRATALGTASWAAYTNPLPFVVRNLDSTINGVGVPAGTYIADALIANGTITNAKIGNAAIDDAKIASLDAGKITTGYLDAARVNVGTLDAKIANLSAAVITSGFINMARIQDAAITAAKILDGEIIDAKIGAFIKSTNFNGTIDAAGNITANGTAGWAVSKGGKAVFQDVVVRGDVQATSLGLCKSSPTGQRTEFDANGMRVYDSNGTMRVRIGVF